MPLKQPESFLLTLTAEGPAYDRRNETVDFQRIKSRQGQWMPNQFFALAVNLIQSGKVGSLVSFYDVDAALEAAWRSDREKGEGAQGFKTIEDAIAAEHFTDNLESPNNSAPIKSSVKNIQAFDLEF